MTASPDRVLSGIQPTADSFHLGNYLGAVRHWVQLQDTCDPFYFIADLHSITVEQAPEQLHRRTLEAFAQVLAAGVDPERSCVFVQSHVPEHTELAWVLMCLTGFGEAGRMTQFKDKSAKGSAASVGLFTYPVLQAADILLYQADHVPVGEDQRQHLELTRDLAERFNRLFGATLTVPAPYIMKGAAKLLDLTDPTAKMSKSSPAGCIFLRDTPKRIEKQLKSAVTDSLGVVRYDPENQPGVSNLLSIIAACTGRTPQVVAADYDGVLYGQLKKDAAAAVLAVAEPFAERTDALLADPAELGRLMAAGADRASAVAAETLAAVYDKVGLVRRP